MAARIRNLSARMNVIVFGSTGRTGKLLLHEALEAGHLVTAFARNPDQVGIKHTRLRLFQGDATRQADVEEALAGQDAVFFAVGTDLGQTNLRQTAMMNIIAGMKKNGVHRLIGIGGMGILQANEEKMIFETPGFPEEYLPVSRDHNAAYNHLMDSGLDFSFFCPPMISDGPKTGHYVTEDSYPPKGRVQITTGDLADAMVKELASPRYSGKRVGITLV